MVIAADDMREWKFALVMRGGESESSYVHGWLYVGTTEYVPYFMPLVTTVSCFFSLPKKTHRDYNHGNNLSNSHVSFFLLYLT